MHLGSEDSVQRSSVDMGEHGQDKASRFFPCVYILSFLSLAITADGSSEYGNHRQTETSSGE